MTLVAGRLDRDRRCCLRSCPRGGHDPVNGVIRFLESNLSRGKTIRIQVEFLGTVYNTPRESLPWYNTLRLDRVRHPGRLLDHGGDRVLDGPETLAKRADRALDRRTLGFLDASARVAAHAGP